MNDSPDERPKWILHPGKVWHRLRDEPTPRGWRRFFVGLLACQFAVVAGFVVFADTSSLDALVGRPHWDRWGLAVVLGLAGNVFGVYAVANGEQLVRVSMGVDFATNVVADQAMTSQLPWLRRVLLRPTAMSYAVSVVVVTLIAVLSEVVAGVIAIALVTWLSALTPISLANAWRRKDSFFGPRFTSRPVLSVLWAAFSGLVCAAIVLGVAWRIDHFRDDHVQFLDELLIVVTVLPIFASFVQPVLTLYRRDRESPELVALRVLLTLFGLGGVVAASVVFSETHDPHWRSAVVSSLQGGAAALLVIPPILAAREPFARLASRIDD